jgi:RNA polymerase sigma-70 factor (ECF subfamily)
VVPGLDEGEDDSVRVDDGFGAFYRTEAEGVFRTVYLLTRDPALAEDATQEAFARALERWRRLQGQAWVGGWVTRTAINVAKRGLRHRDPPRADPHGSGADADATIDLWRGVSRLPPRQQEAVILYYRDDRPVEEIAQILGCREGTVRTHLARARASLRTAVEVDGGVDAQ